MTNKKDKLISIDELDAIELYLECVTACSLSEEGVECFTECLTKQSESNDIKEHNHTKSNI